MPRGPRRSRRSAPRRNADNSVGDNPARVSAERTQSDSSTERGEETAEEASGARAGNEEGVPDESDRDATSMVSPSLKVGTRVMHHLHGNGVITSLGQGTLHGMNMVELEFAADNKLKRRYPLTPAS